MITNGRDALSCVAEKEGKWNWVLVGPNPDSLPLVGGGGGSVDEMRNCLAKQEAEQKAEKQFANFYGLIRMRFGTGRMTRVKYVFVQASRVDEREEEGRPGLKRGNTANVSAVKAGQALANKAAMEKALLAFVHFSAKLDAKSLEDISVDNVIEKVQKASTADADLCTLDTYNAAMEEFLAKYPEMAAQAPESADPENLTAACVDDIYDQELAPNAEAATAEMDDDDEGFMARFYSVKTAAPSAEERRQSHVLAAEVAAAAAPAPPEGVPDEEVKYKRGDLLFVWSNAAKQWMDDGIVVIVLSEDGEHDGLALPAESIKVQYNNRKQFKWVTPAQTKQYVKPSSRPMPPPTLLGELLKETHNFISQWHVRYFELSKGYLQWWLSADDAKSGVIPNGSLSLVGLEMAVKDTVMYLRTSSSKGMIYAFDATTIESIKKWSEMIRQHEEYRRKMQVYFTQRAAEIEEEEKAGTAKKGGQEKFTTAVVERKKRASLVVQG